MLSFILHILLISIVADVQSLNCSPASPQISSVCRPDDHASENLRGTEWIRIIVRFKGPRLMSQDHHSKLRSLLAFEGDAWNWIERNNAASTHPTDFAILSVPMPLDESRRMLSMPSLGEYIRDVHMDRRFVGNLNWIPDNQNKGKGEGEEGEEGEVMPHATDKGSLEALREAVLTGAPDLTIGSFFSQEDLLEAGGDEGGGFGISMVKKRPGRITTRFSFEEWEGPLEPSHVMSSEETEETVERNSIGDPLNRSTQQIHSIGDPLLDSTRNRIDPLPSLETSSRRHLSSSGRHLGPNLNPNPSSHPRLRRLRGLRLPLTTSMGADKIWAKGFSGKGVKVNALSCHPMTPSPVMSPFRPPEPLSCHVTLSTS